MTLCVAIMTNAMCKELDMADKEQWLWLYKKSIPKTILYEMSMSACNFSFLTEICEKNFIHTYVIFFYFYFSFSMQIQLFWCWLVV